MAIIRGVVFDMDDTLYLERDYVRSGFDSVAETLAAQCGANPTELAEFLWKGFLQGARGDSFDRLLAAYSNLTRSFPLLYLVELYHQHTPRIRPLPGVESMLRNLRHSGLKLALLSDGGWFGQELKSQALGLHALLEPVIFTDKLGGEFWKPHTRGFEEIAEIWGHRPDEMVYVGDNPEKDFLAPNLLGWRTVRLRVSGQLRADLEPESEAHRADVEVSSISALQKVLLDWRRPERRRLTKMALSRTDTAFWPRTVTPTPAGQLTRREAV